MKKISIRLFLFISLVMLVSFGAVFFVYRGITTKNIRDKASHALSYIMDLSDEYDADASATAYTADFFSADAQFTYETTDYYPKGVFDEGYESPCRELLLKWYRNHAAEDEKIYFVEDDGSRVYTAMESFGDSVLIYYVNVTSEYELLGNFQIIFWTVIVCCVIAASLLGMMIGRRMEKDQLKQKQFFENASHDLKTPLMSIQGYAEGMEKGIITDSAHACHVILQESSRMASLVDQIMMLSKLESGTLKLQKQDIRLSDLVEDCLMSIAYQAGQRHIEIHLNVPDTVVSADRGQVERAVTNLLSNALRHAESEIAISGSDRQLTFWNDCEMLSPEELKTIFDRFQTGKNGNTGIGLSLAREIVEKHGWKIKAENSENKGKAGVCFKILM